LAAVFRARARWYSTPALTRDGGRQALDVFGSAAAATAQDIGPGFE
jgi:hypothetical protein